MDERRFRLYISIIVGLFGFAGVRVLTQTNPIYDVGEPIFSRLNEFSQDIALINTTEAENADLREGLNELVRQENEELKRAFSSRGERKLIGAEVTRRQLQGFSKQVWINVGGAQKVQAGQTVLHEGALFGVVLESYNNSALVQTVFDPKFRATVNVDGNQGVLKVEHGSLVADLIPSKILTMRPVTTDGLDGETISSIYVGSTDRLVSGESEVFGTYNVLVPYNVFDARFVDVIATEEGL